LVCDLCVPCHGYIVASNCRIRQIAGLLHEYYIDGLYILGRVEV
jgi:hypothetical protein